MKAYLHVLVVLISLVTVLSGLAQVVAPGLVLRFIGAEVTPTSAHFFAIVGMFMALFGGLMLHAIYSPEPNRAAALWAALQKLGAFVAVSLGVLNNIFGLLALGVAFFDLFSGLLFLYFLSTLKDTRNKPIHGFGRSNTAPFLKKGSFLP